MADHSSTRVAYVREVTPGVTPATPAFKALRTTRAAGLRTAKSTQNSDEIRPDGNLADIIKTGEAVSGAYPFEFSYSSFDDWLESVLCGTWSSNVLINGRDLWTHTVEETRRIESGDAFHRFVGVIGSQIDLEVTAEQKITGSVTMMGVREGVESTIVTGATYAAANAEPIMNGAVNVGAITIPGLTSPKIQSFRLSITNNARRRPYVGSLYSDILGIGQVIFSGEVTAYYRDKAVYQAMLDHTFGLTSLTAGVAANKKYKFDLPKSVFGEGQVVEGGNSDDIMVRLPFTAKYDATTDGSGKITRAVA